MKKACEEKLKQALEMCVNEETKNLSDELSFVPSEQFEKKMQKLINSASKPQHKFTLMGVRRTIIIIAAILVFMLSAFSVSAVRDTANNLFSKVFSTSYKSSNKHKPKKKKRKSKQNKHETKTENYSLNNKESQKTNSQPKQKNKHKSKQKVKNKLKVKNKQKNKKEDKKVENFKQIIEEVYELGFLPDGFELVDYIFDSRSILYEYSANDKYINFVQKIESEYFESEENETAIKYVEKYDSVKYTIYAFETGEFSVVWNNGEYVFSISSNLSKEEIIDLCRSIEVVKYIEYSNEINEIYEISALPDGFKLSSFEEGKTEISTKYSSEFYYIYLKQYTNDTHSFGYINDADKKIKVVNDKKYIIYTFFNSGDTMIVWEEGKYNFSITTNLSENEAFNLCEFVAEKEKVLEETTSTVETKTETTKHIETIEEIYELSYLPEGYSMVDYNSDSSQVSYVYCCDDKKINFTQNIESSFSGGVDEVSASVSVEMYDNQEYTIYTFESGDVDIIWNNGNYIFELFGNLDVDTALDMCKTIKIKEN